MSDAEWLKLYENYPQRAHAKLVKEYGNLVYAIVLSKLKGCAGQAEIEDCVSDVFVDVFTSIPVYEPARGSLKSFICTIAARVAADAFKRNMRSRTTISSIEDEGVELPPSGSDIEEDMSKKLLHERLWKIVDSLGEPDSSIIVFQYCYDFTVKEIAQRLKMTAASVQKRSIRARERIRKKLVEENYV